MWLLLWRFDLSNNCSLPVRIGESTPTSLYVNAGEQASGPAVLRREAHLVDGHDLLKRNEVV
jgi:hypothetical protein